MINSKQKLPAPLLSLILVVFPFTVVYWRIHGLINKESLTSATITSEMSNSNQNQGTLLSHFDEANNARYLSALKLVVDGDYQTSQDFEGFNNKTGVDKLIAPNIVHYIRFNCASFKFYEYICLRSAYLQQHPDYIFIHTNVNRFKGKYWNWIEKEADLRTRIVLIKTEIPTEIFGQNFSSFYKVHHASDVKRLQLMMQYGGIYMDNDVYVVHNLDKYRKFELAVGWPRNETIGNQMFIGHRLARFLPAFLETYRKYNSSSWTANSSVYPTKQVLDLKPELVHRVKWDWGTTFLMHELYQLNDWLKQEPTVDAVHLLVNHRSYLDCLHIKYRHFNERNILHYPFTFGKMAKLVLNRTEPLYNITSDHLEC